MISNLIKENFHYHNSRENPICAEHQKIIKKNIKVVCKNFAVEGENICFQNSDFKMKLSHFIYCNVLIQKTLLPKNIEELHYSEINIGGEKYVFLSKFKDCEFECIPLSRIEKIEQGSTSAIFKTISFSGKLFAIKTPSPFEDSPSDQREATLSIYREIEILKILNKNGPQLGIQLTPDYVKYDAFSLPNKCPLFGHLGVFYPLTVFQVITNENYKWQDFFTKPSLYDGILQLLYGNYYATKLGIIHGDIKLENIGLIPKKKGYSFFMFDWGGCINMHQIKEKWEKKEPISRKECLGTVTEKYLNSKEYEALKKFEKFEISYDLYSEINDKRNSLSLGIVIYCLLTGYCPFKLIGEEPVFSDVENGRYTYGNRILNFNAKRIIENEFDQDMVLWMSSVLAPTFENRYSAESAYEAFLNLKDVKKHLKKIKN